ncbi:hypothetical protein OWV82_009873 [Melia azedarach]|uniref:Uncharacterized protein n=1 Tax=Melia azedarach TaxID=155640 RepID=A0ACC1Y445_MELAZ|nr:hypothetical protein OWV82_009873 [Melia azedarach]
MDEIKEKILVYLSLIPFSRSLVSSYQNKINLELGIVGLYPGGNPSRNSRRPGPNPGLRGGLEIVFNQQ